MRGRLLRSGNSRRRSLNGRTIPDSSLTSPGSSGRQGGISATYHSDSGQSSSSTTTLELAMPAVASGATPMEARPGQPIKSSAGAPSGNPTTSQVRACLFLERCPTAGYSDPSQQADGAWGTGTSKGQTDSSLLRTFAVTVINPLASAGAQLVGPMSLPLPTGRDRS